MYLNKLNNEQKELFIDVCIHAAMSNQNFADAQKTLISEYFNEMNRSDVRYTADKDLETALSRLLEISSGTELRMIAIEIMALILSDQQFDEFEKEFMQNFVDKLHIDHEKIAEMHELLLNLMQAYKRIGEFVYED